MSVDSWMERLQRGAMQTFRHEVRLMPSRVQALALCLLLVGAHSLILGTFIYFFTERFYSILFQAPVENLFFVRQSGLFLCCLGLFYLAPLVNLQARHRLVNIIIVTKILAVLFLAANAALTPWPLIIYLTALGDGCMAILLFSFYHRARQVQT